MLDRFLQELELRSKEPAPAPGAVSLATIHGAKGLEFDTVYLIGLAEEILPSWHSVTRHNGSPALEEERRGCFVAITRTKERLILSRAQRYRGWPKQPSRFLAEMGFADDDSDAASGKGAARDDRRPPTLHATSAETGERSGGTTVVAWRQRARLRTRTMSADR